MPNRRDERKSLAQCCIHHLVEPGSPQRMARRGNHRPPACSPTRMSPLPRRFPLDTATVRCGNITRSTQPAAGRMSASHRNEAERLSAFSAWTALRRSGSPGFERRVESEEWFGHSASIPVTCPRGWTSVCSADHRSAGPQRQGGMRQRLRCRHVDRSKWCVPRARHPLDECASCRIAGAEKPDAANRGGGIDSGKRACP
jgi:hypothetical protein